jgi:hypothetical protein
MAVSIKIIVIADETGRSRYKLLGPGSLAGSPGPDCVAHVFVFLGSIIICRLHKLTPSDQAEVTLQLQSVFPI